MIRKRDGLWQIASVGITLIVTLTQLKLLASNLTPEDLGILAIANFALMAANIMADFGIANYIIHKGELSKKELSALWGGSGVLALIAVIFATVIGYVLSLFYSDVVIFEICLLSLFSLISVCFSSVSYACFQSRKMFDIISLSDILGKIVTIFLLFLLFNVDSGIYSLPIAVGVGYFLRFSYLFFKYLNVFGLPSLKDLVDFKCIDGAYRFGKSQLGSQLVNLLGQKIDELIIGRFIGISELGVYNFIKQILMAINGLVSLPTRRLLMPKFRDYNYCARDFLKAYGFYLCLLSFVLTSFFIYSELIVAEYPILTDAYVLIILMVLYWYFRVSAGNLQTAIYTSKGYPEKEFYWNVLQTLAISSIMVISLLMKTDLIGLIILLLVMSLVLFIYSAFYFKGSGYYIGSFSDMMQLGLKFLLLILVFSMLDFYFDGIYLKFFHGIVFSLLMPLYFKKLSK
ncbi:oligosaccharide flippase family protein [Citrobacter portucalensis]|uniref:oligosaccharide flippase family protein n=1 Tax=Citrobacter portucalensis TaxID=1639133 RepID=UPI00403427C0